MSCGSSRSSQPAEQRRQVHARRWRGHRRREGRGRRPGDHRHGHRRRCRAGGPRAHLRVVPAGAARCCRAGGHRPRSDPVPADHRADGRSDVARERVGRWQHVRVHRPRRERRRCRTVTRRRAQRRTATLPTVVVIEDDRPSTDLLTVYLESAGFEVSSAHDGPSGLDAIRRMQPGRCRPRHPAAVRRRVGRARRPQSVTPRPLPFPCRRVDARRAGEGPLARRRRLPRQARQPRRPAGGAGPGWGDAGAASRRRRSDRRGSR